jgi:hypothetical protein
MFKRLNDKLLRWLAKRSGTGEEISGVALDAQGIQVSLRSAEGATKTRTIAWSEIDAIVAFRRETVAHGVLYLLIRSRGDVLELPEDVPGWDRLVRELGAHLALAVPFEAWQPRLAFTAREPSSLTLYKRELP